MATRIKYTHILIINMPLYKTVFKKSWISDEVKDRNGDSLSSWCGSAKNDKHSAYCRVCCSVFSIGNGGSTQILHHADGTKHMKRMESSRGQSILKTQLKMSTVTATTSASDVEASTSGRGDAQCTMTKILKLAPPNSSKWIPSSLDDQAKKAEILFALKLAASNFSFQSYSDITENDSSDICRYWDYVTRLRDVAGDKKYKVLGEVVKSALSLSHGNAAPERGFSVNNSLLSKERLALGEDTICATRIVKEAVRLYGSSVTAVPLTKNLIACSRKAHAEYVLHLEKEQHEKKRKLEEQRKTEVMDQELTVLSASKESVCKLIDEQNTLEAQQTQQQETSKLLISEATAKMSVSLKNNSMQDAKVAQVMLSAGNERLQETSKQLSSIREAKERYQQKLEKLERKLRDLSAASHAKVEEPAAKKRK